MLLLLSWTLLIGQGLCATHNLFTSSFTTPHIYALQFDDQRNTLTTVANITAHDGHPSLAFSYDRTGLYASEKGGVASYYVANGGSLIYQKSLVMPQGCTTESNFGPAYVTTEDRVPFAVYAGPYGACGATMSVDPNRVLGNVIQSFTYESNSGVHGVALGPENKWLYAADVKRNGIWTFAVDANTGALTKYAFTASPIQNGGPRRLLVHPNGQYLYALFENANTVATFALQYGEGWEKDPLKFTGVLYSLIPAGAPPSEYWGSEIALSADANVLYATTRYKIPGTTTTRNGATSEADYNKSRGNGRSYAGYVTAILLTSIAEAVEPLEGRLTGAGFPLRLLFQIPTTSSGGMSNSVSPAPWSNDHFAISDSEYGRVQIYKLDGLATVNYTGPVAVGAQGAPVGGWYRGMWSTTKGNVVTPADGSTIPTGLTDPEGLEGAQILGPATQLPPPPAWADRPAGPTQVAQPPPAWATAPVAAPRPAQPVQQQSSWWPFRRDLSEENQAQSPEKRQATGVSARMIAEWRAPATGGTPPNYVPPPPPQRPTQTQPQWQRPTQQQQPWQSWQNYDYDDDEDDYGFGSWWGKRKARRQETPPDADFVPFDALPFVNPDYSSNAPPSELLQQQAQQFNDIETLRSTTQGASNDGRACCSNVLWYS